MKKFIMIAIAIAAICGIEYQYQENKKNSEKIVSEFVARGIVSEKSVEDYACGSKRRSICYTYLMTINGVNHAVEQQLYTTTRVGEHVELYRKYKENLTLGDLFISFLRTVMFGLLALSSLYWIFDFFDYLRHSPRSYIGHLMKELKNFSS